MKIAVAMSGGVDSSAAAAVLKQQGHDLVGFTMQLWNQRRGISVDANGEPLPSRCCSLDDVYDARRVAEELGFPFYVLNLERDFERDVVQPFVASYLNGETPIPCVGCNSRLKFSSLDRLAASLDCEKVATGHYARVEYDAARNRYKLLRGLNHGKDQSYFLWELTQDQLSRAMFPLGEMSKPEARDAARQHHLAVAEKVESLANIRAFITTPSDNVAVSESRMNDRCMLFRSTLRTIASRWDHRKNCSEGSLLL